MILLMVYDLLIGHNRIIGGGKWKQTILKHQNALKTSLARIKIKKGVFFKF